MKQWDHIFKSKGRVFDSIQEDIPRVTRFIKKRNKKKVLDIGCGSGRHTVYFARNGFNVYGMDNSTIGISIAKNWLKKEKLSARIKHCSIFSPFPFKDNFFDAAISTQVLYHGVEDKIFTAIKQIERVLKPGGIFFATFIIDKNRKRKFKYVAPRTYLPLKGPEKNLEHFFYNKTLLKKHFCNFHIHDIWITGRYYCLLGELPVS